MVAPVLSTDGTIDYYVPAGNWTNFITGEVQSGPKWVSEKHGFLSAPLLVRPSSIIAVGSNNSRPDYDYVNGVTLQVYELEDGHEASAMVPNVSGGATPDLVAMISRMGSTLLVKVVQPSDVKARGLWTVLLVGVHSISSVDGGSASSTQQGVLIEPTGETVTIRLD